MFRKDPDTASLSIRTPLDPRTWNLEGGSYTGDFERWRTPLLGTPKDMLSKAQNWASASKGAPLLGNMELRFFLGAFLFRVIFMRFSREMQMPCKRVSLSIGALLGNLEGVCLPGYLRENKKYIWGPFLDPEDIKILSLGGHLEL
jgi:hypothetical protein